MEANVFCNGLCESNEIEKRIMANRTNNIPLFHLICLEEYGLTCMYDTLFGILKALIASIPKEPYPVMNNLTPDSTLPQYTSY